MLAWYVSCSESLKRTSFMRIERPVLLRIKRAQLRQRIPPPSSDDDHLLGLRSPGAGRLTRDIADRGLSDPGRAASATGYSDLSAIGVTRSYPV